MLVILISKYDIISVLFALNLSYRVVVTVWHPVSTRPIDALPYLAIFVYGYYGICGNFISVLFALNLSYRVVVTVWHPVSTRPIDALPYLAIFVYGYYGICGNFLRQFSCGQNPPCLSICPMGLVRFARPVIVVKCTAAIFFLTVDSKFITAKTTLK